MAAVLCSQFLSALADNALLFGALALLKMHHYAAWTSPLLQEFFVGAYIILAPFAGPFADSQPKGRVMLLSNALKLAGSLGIAAGLNPFLAYGLVGVGAATYSPAKYGILSELTSAEHLVQANGLMEGSTIAAILIGAIAGGTLADWNVLGTLLVVSAVYALALLTNLAIPRLASAHALTGISLGAVLRDFRRALARLWRVPEARLSVCGTSLFWGTGSTLRFLLIAWVPLALGITNNRMPAFLNAVVAGGIVVGAGLAARFVPLERAYRALTGGVVLGIALCALALTTHLINTFLILTVIGAAGGFFIVPLNAVLQERGQQSVGAGHAIAIQNLAENGTMLVMIGVYTVVIRAGAPVIGVATGFGVLLTLGMLALVWQGTRLRRITITPDPKTTAG